MAAAALDGEPEPCTPEMIICENPPGDDFEEVYLESVEASVVEPMSVQEYSGPSYSSTVGPIPCIPGFTQSAKLLIIPVPTPGGGFPENKSVMFSGLWVLESYIGGYGSSSAYYIFPPGYFPAADGSGVQVTVGKGLANCSYVQGGQYTVTFYRYYQVNGRWPRSRPASNGGGYVGPGGGTPDGCSWDFSILEINYGDGTGWHTIWEGWALWCGF